MMSYVPKLKNYVDKKNLANFSYAAKQYKLDHAKFSHNLYHFVLLIEKFLSEMSLYSEKKLKQHCVFLIKSKLNQILQHYFSQVCKEIISRAEVVC